MSLDLSFVLVWLIAAIVFLILPVWLIHGHRKKSHHLQVRLVPNHLHLFHQRQRKRHSTLIRLSRLD